MSNAKLFRGVHRLGGTNPTSTVVGVSSANASSDVYYLYCWHRVQGFSKFGNFYGNANADDKTLYKLDFTPSILILKRIWFR